MANYKAQERVSQHSDHSVVTIIHTCALCSPFDIISIGISAPSHARWHSGDLVRPMTSLLSTLL